MDVKTKSLEAVLAKVAHDLRTPLAVVHTATNMLLNPKYQLTPEQVRDQHERIRRNTDVMNHMIGELSDLAQIHSGTLAIDAKPTNVGEILREAVAANDGSARDKGITLSCEAGNDSSAPADRTRLLQVFQNLLHHAVGASGSSDRISVGTQVRDDSVQIEIVVSGLELTAEDLPHVFEPWTNGSGLGLFIGKGIVEAHGGQIRCSSQAGSGTTFSVTLPLARRDA